MTSHKENLLMELIPGLSYDIGLECLVRIPYKYFSSIVSVSQTWKVEMELPEFWRRRKAAGLSQQVVVMAQARVDTKQKPESVKNSATPVYRLTVLEPETGCWAELPTPPGCSNGLPMFCQLAGVGTSLVVIGGLNRDTWEITNAVFVYDFVSATWRRGADMPGCRRSFFACCASDSDRMVFVAGGHDDEKNALQSALAYNVVKDKWIPLPDMASERDECKGVFHSGKFHVIGGYQTNMQGGFETSVETFDVAKWQWDAVKDDFLASPMCPRTCVDGENKKLYICQDGALLALENSTWHIVVELPVDVRNTSYVTTWVGKLFVIGSPRFDDSYKCYMLDLKNLTWTRIDATEDFSGHVQSGCCLDL